MMIRYEFMLISFSYEQILSFNYKKNSLLSANHKYMKKYFPTSKQELIKLIDIYDNPVPLDEIDTSQITDMSWLFANSKRTNRDWLETWDVSNVKDMNNMFINIYNVLWQDFKPNLRDWNVSNVVNMSYMFSYIRSSIKWSDLSSLWLHNLGCK